MENETPQSIHEIMGTNYGLSRQQRYSLNVVNPKLGDKVDPQRIDNPLNVSSSNIATYLEFNQTTTPPSPPSNAIRIYTKAIGSSSKLFVLNTSGTESEILTSASVSLNTAYANGSVVDVNVADVQWRLTGANSFIIKNAAGSVNRFSVSNTAIDNSVPVNFLDSALFSTTKQMRFRDTATYISSKDLGYLDADATTGFRFNTGLVGINTTPTATLDILEVASTGAAPAGLYYQNAGHTALTTSTEHSFVNLDMSTSIEFATGNLTLQRAARIQPAVYDFVGASTITTATTLAIGGASNAGVNASITNSHGVYIESAPLTGSVTSAWGLSVNAPTGASNNYAAQFIGNVGIGTSTPSYPLDVTGTTRLAGNIRHTGTSLGFFSATPAVQQTSGANITNNVTTGGVDGTIANFTDLAIYANDAATIRNDIYQLARSVKIINDALRLYGLLT